MLTCATCLSWYGVAGSQRSPGPAPRRKCPSGERLTRPESYSTVRIVRFERFRRMHDGHRRQRHELNGHRQRASSRSRRRRGSTRCRSRATASVATGLTAPHRPGSWEVGGRSMNHWFDGLAMLHRFSFARGEVSYANRFLETRAYRAAQDTGRITYSEFATDPCRSLFQRVKHDVLAEDQRQRQRQPGEARRAVHRDDRNADSRPVRSRHARRRRRRVQAPGQLTTAHPHMDRASKGMLNYAAKLGRANTTGSSWSARTATRRVDRLAASTRARRTCTRSG